MLLSGAQILLAGKTHNTEGIQISAMANKHNNKNIHTESDVEQKVIYRLLTTALPHGLGYIDSEVLTKPDIRKIEIDKGKKKILYYPDYIVLVSGLPCLIVEAKAPGEDLAEAAREGRLYATEINSCYKQNVNPCSKIIVSDGNIIIGYHWDSVEPILSLNINNINPSDSNFDAFIGLFSKSQLYGHADNILKLLKKNATYYKPVHMLGGKSVISQTVGQNSFGSNVSLEYKYLFNPDSIEDRESIVKNAYVESKRKQSHVSPIDKLIRAAIPKSMIDAKPVHDTTSPKEIINEICNTNKVKNEILLLIGSVGSGKSTFTDYLRSVALPYSLASRTDWVNANLNNAPLSKDLIYEWLVSEIKNAIKKKYKKIDFDHIDTIMEIYNKELDIIKKGRASLYPKDSEKYKDIIYQELERLQRDSTGTLKSMIEYIYNKSNKLFVIVLDNCDKRNRDDQLLMFEVATWLKVTFPCMIFLPLRDSTYDQYCNEPPLDTVIKDLVFRIDPPLLERVVYSRLKYALREINNKKEKFYYYLPNNARVECNRNEVGVYMNCIVTSLFQDNLFRRIITGLAGRNIRKGLEIFLDFCKSGHITEDIIFKIRQSGGDYKLPSYLISKIILKGNRKYYYDKESKVKNLFFSDENDSLPDPFVRISILLWLKRMYREYGPNRTKGYHKVEHLLKELQMLGHPKPRVITEIETLAEANCVDTETQSAVITENDLISISPAGFIHLDLMKNISYLSSISEDTLFRENQIAKKIADNITGRGKHQIGSRQSEISNSKALIDYMCSYQEEYFSGSTKALSESHSADLIELNEIQKYVNDKASNDTKYHKKDIYESKYPPGMEVRAQIVSVQTYGFFVEFELDGAGFIHKSSFPNNFRDILNISEEGDWVAARIIAYNTEHNKFDLELVDVLSPAVPTISA